MSPVASYPYTWHWRTKHGERHRQPCRVWARGSMNSIGVEFADGFRTVTARFAVRKGSHRCASPSPSGLGAEHRRRGRLERPRELIDWRA
jgi:hypothetical protein